MRTEDLPDLPSEGHQGHPPNLGSYLRMLEDDEQELLGRLRTGPTPEQLYLLRQERMWSKMAWIDVYPWLVQWFTPEEDWLIDPQRSGPIEETGAVGVAWTFGGVHDTDGVFNGLPATRRHVLVRGFTVMSMGDGTQEYRFVFSRYIDWVDLYNQLGLTINWRIPIELDPVDSGDAPRGE